MQSKIGGKCFMIKKYYFTGAMFSLIMLLLLIMLDNIIDSMIVLWFSGPASIIYIMPWFKIEMLTNIIASILFIGYYSLYFSMILKYYYLKNKKKILFIIVIMIIINTISMIISIKYFPINIHF